MASSSCGIPPNLSAEENQRLSSVFVELAENKPLVALRVLPVGRRREFHPRRSSTPTTQQPTDRDAGVRDSCRGW